MANKEIKIRWLSDDSAIDQSIQRLQQKLKQMNQSQAQIQNIQETGGTLSKRAEYAQKAFQKSSADLLQRESRELEQKQRKESLGLLEKQRELRKIEQSEGNITAEKQKQIDLLKEEINLRSQKIMDIESTRQEIDRKTREVTGGDGGGGARGAAGGLGGFISKITQNINPMKIATAMLGAANMYGQHLSIMQTREREVQGYRGQQTQAQNLGFQDVMRNQGFMRYFEKPERERAMQMAMEERRARLQVDPLKAAVNIGGQALAGGAAGSFIGGPWGAGIGAIAGAGNAIFGNKGIYRQLFDREAYMADVNSETMRNYRGNLANLRLQNPEKYAAAEQLGKRAGYMQQLQRRLNLSDEELFGGNFQTIRRKTEGEMTPEERVKANVEYTGDRYKITESDAQLAERQRLIDEDNKKRQKGFVESQMYDRTGARAFSEERIKQNIQDIFMAGGSSAFVRQGGAGMAAEYQRGGFLNAGRELGAISGITGGKEQTEQAYIKMLAEGVKLGFNASEPSEEMRKYTQVATQLFQQTAGAEGAVSMLGKGMAGTSMASIQAAQNVFNRRNEEAGEATGYRGALKQSFLVSKRGQELFGNVSENMKQYFTEANLKNLDKDNPMIQRLADEQFGGDTDKALNAIREMQDYGSNLSEETDIARDKLRKSYKAWLKKGGMKNSAANIEKYMSTKEGRKVSTDYQAAYALERQGVGQMNTEQVQANIAYAASGFEIEGADTTGVKIRGGGRALDKREAGLAADQQAQLVAIARNIEKLTSAYEKNAESSLGALLKILKTEDMEKFIEKIEQSDKNLASAIFSAFVTGQELNLSDQPNVGTEEK